MKPLRAFLLVAFCASFAPAVSGASGSVASAPPDTCGFRAAAWSYVQVSADFIGKVQSIGTGPTDPTSADARYLRQALRDTILDMAADFGQPAGWENLRYYLGHVMVELRQALLEFEKTTGIHLLPGAPLAAAQSDQRNAWRTIAAVCPGGGKSTTAAHAVRFYEWFDGVTKSYALHAPWSISYNFDCRGGTVPNRFLLTLRSGQNALVATLADEIGPAGSGSQTLHRSGRFYFKAQTGCYWHLRIAH